jgi:cystathionine beta-lyase
VSSGDAKDFEKLIKENTKLIYIETPSNPLLRITDIKAIVEVAKKHHILSIIDNTFATPINQNPFLLGMDIIIHSGTKYLNGHSDLCCGAVCGTRSHIDRIGEVALLHGGSPSTQDCYMLERGKTFPTYV